MVANRNHDIGARWQAESGAVLDEGVFHHHLDMTTAVHGLHRIGDEIVQNLVDLTGFHFGAPEPLGIRTGTEDMPTTCSLSFSIIGLKRVSLMRSG